MTKKIGWYNARNIAQAVAEKAFEHIFNPVNDELKAVAQAAYTNMVSNLDYKTVKILSDAHVLNQRNVCNVKFSHAEPNQTDIEVVIGDEMSAETPYITSVIFVVDALSTHKANEVNACLVPIEQARRSLATRVQEDIDGKTVPSVCKLWPEIAPFVNEETGITDKPELEVPFGDLIKRYMQPFAALPAPV